MNVLSNPPSQADSHPLRAPRDARAMTRGGLVAAGIAAAVVAALHLATAGRYDLFVNELYFIVCGGRPGWGYVDQPPVISGHNQYFLWGPRGHDGSVTPAVGPSSTELHCGCRLARRYDRISQQRGEM